MALGAVSDLRRVESFVAVAEELHFGRAAARLYISQPALSQQIRALETDLGIELFLRLPSGVQLTAEGQTLVPEARELLMQAERFVALAGVAARSVEGHVRLGFVDHARAAVLPVLLDAVAVAAPQLELTLHSFATSRLALDALIAGDCDAIVGDCSETPDVETVALAVEPYVAAVPADHRLAEQAEVSLRDLASEPFAMFPRALNPAGWESFMARFDEAGQRPAVIHEGRRISDTILFVSRGRAVAIIPAPLASSLAEPSIAFRPLTGPAPENHIVAAWMRRSTNPAVRVVAAAARASRHGSAAADEGPRAAAPAGNRLAENAPGPAGADQGAS